MFPQKERIAEGRSASSLNASRHGLTGQVTIMTPEERVVHDTFFAGYFESLQPEGAVERDLAEAIAENAWRLKRARSIDQNMFAAAHPDFTGHIEGRPEIVTALAEAKAFVAGAQQFQLLTLYEQRIQRSADKSLALLNTLQAGRKAARDKAFEEAKLLAQLNYLKDKPYDPSFDFPAENGFAFSSAEINASIRRDQRVRQATHDSRKEFDPSHTRDRFKLNIIDLAAAA
jgi:hypothetical protein